MIVRSKAPLRLGLAGGGTDVSPYSDLYGGTVLNATINLYTYCTLEERTDGLITINSFDSNCFKSYSSAEFLQIDGEASLIKGVYNRIQREYHIGAKSFRITTYSDASAGCGLGTSSTMVVCILKAFAEWLFLPLGDYEMARLAYEIERKDLAFSGGKQDQYAAAFGGFNYMEFLKDDSVIINPLKIKRWICDELESSIVLYFTGASRNSTTIINEQKKNAAEGNASAIEAMHRIKASANEMKVALLKGDVRGIAAILQHAWEDKKKMAKSISNPVIQEAMDAAMQSGAIAGKVSGAGGGGFIIFMVNPEKRINVISSLKKLGGQIVPFQFSEGGAHGWKIFE